jgi:hypothetical protein
MKKGCIYTCIVKLRIRKNLALRVTELGTMFPEWRIKTVIPRHGCRKMRGWKKKQGPFHIDECGCSDLFRDKKAYNNLGFGSVGVFTRQRKIDVTFVSVTYNTGNFVNFKTAGFSVMYNFMIVTLLQEIRFRGRYLR